MHGHKIVHQHGLHFITFTVIAWIDVFTRQVYRDKLIESLKFYQDNRGLRINSFVIMSNHIHRIANSPKNRLSEIIRDFKKYTSLQIVESIKKNPRESRKNWLLGIFNEHAKLNRKNKNYQFWIQNNKPIELFNPKWINQKINYIHLNPVKAGIVEFPEHYIYSSAINYLGKKGILDVEVINIDNDANYFVG